MSASPAQPRPARPAGPKPGRWPTSAAPPGPGERADRPTSAPSGQPAPAFASAIYGLLHPAQVAIVEALLWIDRPLSATRLAACLGAWPANALNHHVRRFAAVGVLVPTHTELCRGTAENFYELAR